MLAKYSRSAAVCLPAHLIAPAIAFFAISFSSMVENISSSSTISNASLAKFIRLLFCFRCQSVGAILEDDLIEHFIESIGYTVSVMGSHLLRLQIGRHDGV